MGTFLSKALIDFFIAFGVVLGGSILAGIGAVVALQSPVDTMQHISEQLKIWAVVAAVGGTIDPIRVIESNFLDGNLSRSSSSCSTSSSPSSAPIWEPS